MNRATPLALTTTQLTAWKVLHDRCSTRVKRGAAPAIWHNWLVALRVKPLQRMKWRWRYVVKQTRRHARSWMLGAPGSSSASRSIWICSWQRSGSTWLAEMLSESRGTRLVYEPANLANRAFDGVRAASLAMPAEGGRATGLVAAALYGTLRGDWVDQHNHAHYVRRRVVKDVRALSLAGEVHAKVPDSSVIILIRHPIAVARSVRELGWIDPAGLEGAFEREVERWCEAHVRAFSDPRLNDVHFVDYSALRSDPKGELMRIASYAAQRNRTWRAVKVDRIDYARASSTNFRGSATSDSTELDWRSVNPTLIESAVSTLARFGLDGLYDETPRAKVDVNEFVRAFRSAPR